ncbi:MAG: NAD(P)H-dependent glycerol-3-phosphate dehydrogenase [Bacteroidales bacterium]|jgi:glycerol-3-phosphate dehydrogenase (NAD(P)+)|nr:NAD(P)H-dependent glycerol-3-phosphate dehydrogenase [Bacteroidales bacterium]MDX9799335.1 NAD(P)H-dependent glycerol-3-phosphate dehydrogenase [Bacteroidales bacterium]
MKIAIFGSGSWATAIVKIASETHQEVFWWVREKEIVEGLKKYNHNPLYLSQCELDSNKIKISNDIKKIISKADNLLFVIPSAFFARSLEGLNSEDFKNKNVISATKGIVPETNQIVAEYMKEKYDVSYANQAVISGPSHAEEIAKENLTYLTVGSHNPLLAKHIADSFQCRYVKTTISKDIEGIEYVGIMKNIYALSVGICKGLGFGDNFISVVVANGLREMDDFLSVCSPMDERNIHNLAYLGDLLVTCYSQHSRNRTFGQMIGFGYSVNSAQLEMKMVAEGYYAAKCIHDLNKKFGAKIPIADAVYRILYKASSAKKEFDQLSNNFQ